jgi:hypothetical protein
MQKMGVAATLSADNLLVKWWDRLSQTPRF